MTDARPSPAKTASTEVEMLTFRLANQQFGIDMSSIREIVRMPPITRVPLSPEYILGVANLRGDVTPVLNGSIRLGRPSEPTTKRSRVLVLSVGKSSLGFSVDEVNRILKFAPDQIEPAPEESKASGNLISGVIHHEGTPVFKISPPSLIDGETKLSKLDTSVSSKASEAAPETVEETRKVVVVQIGSEEFGIDIGQVSEVIRFTEPNPVPNAPAFLAGLITVRSHAIPLIDLRALMQRLSLREETLRKTAQLRAEYEKAQATLEKPQISAGFLQNATRLLDLMGIHSVTVTGLQKRSAELHDKIRSTGAAPDLGSRIREIADQLSEIDQAAANDEDRRILVIETDGARFGVSVDRVSQVLDIPASSIQPPPPIVPQKGVQLEALAHLKNPARLVLLLNLAEMVAKNRMLSAHTQPALNADTHDLMPTASRSDHGKWVSFIVGEEQFGLPIADVIEIGRVETITRVPSAPKFIRGVINLRGEIIPVVDLRVRFGMEAKASTMQSRMVYIRSGSVVIGLVVDRVLEIIELSDIQPPPPAIRSKRVIEYLAGIAKHGDQVILLLSSERFFTETEQERIEEASKKLKGSSSRSRNKV